MLRIGGSCTPISWQGRLSSPSSKKSLRMSAGRLKSATNSTGCRLNRLAQLRPLGSGGSYHTMTVTANQLALANSILTGPNLIFTG